VTFEINPENLARETSSLLKAGAEFSCNDLNIITWDQEEDIELQGTRIKVFPLWKWLRR